MGWTVILEDERGKKESILKDQFNNKYFDGKEYKLLHYLDPYGNIIFNQLQIPDLVNDFQKLKMIDDDPMIDEIIDLAIRCKDEVHHYLVFYGD